MKNDYFVLDTHIHIGVSMGAQFIAEEDLIPYMDKYNINMAFVMQHTQGYTHKTPEWNPYTGNDYIAKIQRKFPNRVIGLATINPWFQAPKKYSLPIERRGQEFDRIHRSPSLEEIERCMWDLELHGLKIHPMESGYPIQHRALLHPIMDRMLSCQNQTGRRMVVVIHAASDSIYNTPEGIADLASHYPDLLFIMAHAGFIWNGRTMLQAIGHLDNVMIDLTTMPQKSVVLSAYEQLGPERFTAGSDAPFATPTIKDAIVDDICNNKEEKKLVLGGNLIRYLEIKEAT